MDASGEQQQQQERATYLGDDGELTDATAESGDDYLNSLHLNYRITCTDPNCSFWQRVALISQQGNAPRSLMFMSATDELTQDSKQRQPIQPSTKSPSPPVAHLAQKACISPLSSLCSAGPNQLLPKLSFARRNSSCSTASLSPTTAKAGVLAQARGLAAAASCSRPFVEKSPSASSLSAAKRAPAETSSAPLSGARQQQLVKNSPIDTLPRDSHVENDNELAERSSAPSSERAARLTPADVAISITDTSDAGSVRARARRQRRRRRSSTSSTSSGDLSSSSSGSDNEPDQVGPPDQLRQSRSSSAILSAEQTSASEGGHSDEDRQATSGGEKSANKGAAMSKQSSAKRSDNNLPIRHHSINERPKHLYVTPSFLLQHEQLDGGSSPANSCGANQRRIGSHSPSRFNFGGG